MSLIILIIRKFCKTCGYVQRYQPYFVHDYVQFSKVIIYLIIQFNKLILLTRPDSSKTSALYKSCTYLLTYLLKLDYQFSGAWL